MLLFYLQVLVHGEANEMSRLKTALLREYEDDEESHIQIHNPRITQAVELYFRGEKMAKVKRHLIPLRHWTCGVAYSNICMYNKHVEIKTCLVIEVARE